jgi:hypothetical protein
LPIDYAEEIFLIEMSRKQRETLSFSVLEDDDPRRFDYADDSMYGLQEILPSKEKRT